MSRGINRTGVQKLERFHRCEDELLSMDVWDGLDGQRRQGDRLPRFPWELGLQDLKDYRPYTSF